MKSISFLLPAVTLATLFITLPSSRAALVVMDDFEAGEGHFASAPNASGSIRRVLASSTAEQNLTSFYQGAASQQLVIDRNPDPAAPAPTFPAGPGEWFLRFLSGGGTIANNTPIPNTGNTWVGFWARTTNSNIQAGIMLDDDVAGGSNNHEISVFIPLAADGLWHLYQFELANANLWETFAGAQANPGAINSPTVTIDSLVFLGAAGVQDSVTFFLDNITYSTDGPIPVPEPSAIAFGLFGGLALLRRKR